VIAANIKLCGALLAYATPEIAAFVKQAVGYNFAPRELGEQMMASILELVRTGDVRPVIGSVVPFEELPSAIEAMAKRQTTGRTIVMV
jgi:NADPH2:quinone reductase